MSPPTKASLRRRLQDELDPTINRVNAALRGKSIVKLEPVLLRLGRGGHLPHWYEGLKRSHTLPNLDGKTIGSVVEMILVAVLETSTFAGLQVPPLRINPARGVDLPDLDLGVKSPSTNFCTSEPFFSAYERLTGSDHDALILLTDYQEAKKRPPLRLQILRHRYLRKTQIADHGLCATARKHRKALLEENEAWARKFFRFLAYVNQSDWLAKRLLGLAENLDVETTIRRQVADSEDDFQRVNAAREEASRPPIPEEDLESVRRVAKTRPLRLGVIDAADNWVLSSLKDASRPPNDNEWQRLCDGPLDGAIGMSFALQWRYNFGRIFNGSTDEAEDSD